MSRTGPVRAAFVCACLLTVPLLTFAQSAGHPAVTSSSDSHVMLAELPDAPLPTAVQSTSAQSTSAASTSAQSQSSTPNQKQQPNAPSLGDLGFTPGQTKSNAVLQARLNKRTHMLKVHQTLGLITLAPMAAAVIASGGATPKHNRGRGGPVVEPSSAGVDLHAALGATTVAMYAATAYYAMRAPSIEGVKPRGAIRLHRALVWVHGPGMVLTPILGAMALHEENLGQRPHGIAAAHSAVAWTTVLAYGASVVAVSWPLHLKFWEKQ